MIRGGTEVGAGNFSPDHVLMLRRDFGPWLFQIVVVETVLAYVSSAVALLYSRVVSYLESPGGIAALGVGLGLFLLGQWLPLRGEWYRGCVELSREGVRLVRPSGKTESRRWQDLKEVVALTTLRFNDGGRLVIGAYVQENEFVAAAWDMSGHHPALRRAAVHYKITDFSDDPFERAE